VSGPVVQEITDDAKSIATRVGMGKAEGSFSCRFKVRGKWDRSS
jgi:hypothetical protein